MKKERIIVLISSILILTALTLTGIFMRSEDTGDENLVVDFGEIEKIGEDKTGAGSDTEGLTQTESKQISRDTGTDKQEESTVKQPDADIIKALEDVVKGEADNKTEAEDSQKSTDEALTSDANEIEGDVALGYSEDEFDDAVEVPEVIESETVVDAGIEETPVNNAVTSSVLPELTFNAEESVIWPFAGDVLIPFSMDSTVYFKTLDQYKYSTAAVISAIEGDMVVAPVNAIVTDIFETSQTGQTIVLDLGNGYELTLGQLKDISVTKGEYVTRGQSLATVSAPTKYYCIEGTNVYVELTQNDVAINPVYE